MKSKFEKFKKLGGGVALLLIITLFFSAFLFLKQDKSIYASNETDSEISLLAEGEISSLEVEVDYT